jgi:hypothetical protein
VQNFLYIIIPQKSRKAKNVPNSVIREKLKFFLTCNHELHFASQLLITADISVEGRIKFILKTLNRYIFRHSSAVFWVTTPCGLVGREQQRDALRPFQGWRSRLMFLRNFRTYHDVGMSPEGTHAKNESRFLHPVCAAKLLCCVFVI